MSEAAGDRAVSRSEDRAFWLRLGAILAGALAVRLVYTILVPGNAASPGPTGDFFYYHDIANLIAGGRGFISPFVLEHVHQTVSTAEHPPLWPLVLSAASEVGGNGLLSHRLVGAPIGVAVVAVLALIGRRLGGPTAGLVVAALAAVHPLLVAADGSLMSETLYGLFLALSLLAALRLLERPTAGRAALLGAAIGLAALTRGEGLLLIALLAVPAAWAAAGDGRARRIGAALAATALVLAPWAVRNWIELDRPILTSTNDSTVLAGANCRSTYHGRDLGFWRVDCFPPVKLGRREIEQADAYRRAGREYATDHAGRLVGVVMPVRVLRTWGVWRPGAQIKQAEGRDRTTERAGVVVYFLLLPLALYGAIVLRRRSGPLWVLIVPVVLVTLVSALAYGYMRFRHGADLALVVLAGLALADRLGRYRTNVR